MTSFKMNKIVIKITRHIYQTMNQNIYNNTQHKQKRHKCLKKIALIENGRTEVDVHCRLS